MLAVAASTMQYVNEVGDDDIFDHIVKEKRCHTEDQTDGLANKCMMENSCIGLNLICTRSDLC